MFRHLLVPLDGSSFAEAVMPAVRHFAELGVEITFLHMLERKPPRKSTASRISPQRKRRKSI